MTLKRKGTELGRHRKLSSQPQEVGLPEGCVCVCVVQIEREGGLKEGFESGGFLLKRYELCFTMSAKARQLQNRRK